MRTKKKTKSTMDIVNEILEISDSYQAPDKVLDALFDKESREKMFFKFMEAFEYDFSYEWFYQYFQDEHADRKNNKQDFTPVCVSNLISEMICGKKDDNYTVIEEPAAGTGSTIIAHWYKTVRECQFIWNYSPDDYLYVCSELSSKTLPFLLFNLMIRGVNAIVIHGDSLALKTKNVYWIYNESNNAMGFSDIYQLPHEKRFEEMLNIIWESDFSEECPDFDN